MRLTIVLVGLFEHGWAVGAAWGQATKDPTISLQVSGLDATEPWTFGIRILFLLTVLTVAPALLMLVTSFTRVVIVLGLLRQALGTMHAPPNQVMIALALFLTIFIMMPVWEKIRGEALNPYLEHQITQQVAMDRAIEPIRQFMMKQVREKDLALFMEMANRPTPQTQSDVPLHVLVPAFVISELRTAFQIGFLIYIPFLVIDMIVASILMSMGMMLLPPVMISLPFKLVLFVLADGWFLIVGSLMNSFQ
ncbi:MAG: flagellar type III secretion system pore protein FliP [Nitrospirales bacterium]|nr:flagellar type III secretion system pore protein FliP [Nitrospirales bacterium]